MASVECMSPWRMSQRRIGLGVTGLMSANESVGARSTRKYPPGAFARSRRRVDFRSLPASQARRRGEREVAKQMMLQLCYRVLNTRWGSSAASRAVGDCLALDWGARRAGASKCQSPIPQKLTEPNMRSD